jgi:Holliday junction resolvase
MAITPEKKVKQKVTQILKELGAYYFYPMTGGYGASGVPDIIGCLNGRFFGIECKAGRGKPTLLQLNHLKAIQESGGTALLINESNTEELVTRLMTASSHDFL